MGSDKREEYLIKAENADDESSRVQNPAAKEAWKRIATAYRELAQLRSKSPKKGP